LLPRDVVRLVTWSMVPWQSTHSISTACSMKPWMSPSPITSRTVWQSTQCIPFSWWMSGGTILGSFT
jgi:hypothetical protein